MTIITETITDGSGPAPVARVELRLWSAEGPLHGWVKADGRLVAAAHALLPDPETGTWTAEVPANEAVDPANTVWRRTVVLKDGTTLWDDLVVPESEEPLQVRDLVTPAVDAPVPSWGAALAQRVAGLESQIEDLAADVSDLAGRVDDVESALPQKADVGPVSALEGRVDALEAPTEVHHSWSRDGWDPFDAITITAHGAQTFVPSVENNQGVLTSTEPGLGSLRVAYAHEATDGWADSEITSAIIGPVGPVAWTGDNAQQGHLHRIAEVTPGVWRAIAIWTSVVFGNGYNHLHVALVEWDGATLTQNGPADSGFGSAGAAWIDRQTIAIAHARVLGVADRFQLATPARLAHLVSGDRVDLASFSDPLLNGTGREVQPVDPEGIMNVIRPDAQADAPWSFARGVIRPAANPKRYAPFGLRTRVTNDGDDIVVEAIRWRHNVDPEPGWDHPSAQRSVITPGGNVAAAPAAGKCGLWGAHFYGGSAGAWGDIRFRRL